MELGFRHIFGQGESYSRRDTKANGITGRINQLVVLIFGIICMGETKGRDEQPSLGLCSGEMYCTLWSSKRKLFQRPSKAMDFVGED